MLEIILWLKSLEKLARDFYRDSAEVFKNYKDLHEFLLELADDEDYHYRIMDNAGEYINLHGMIKPTVIQLDKGTKDKIERIFKEYRERMNCGEMSEEELLTAILDIEYSEFNDFCIYVLESLKESSREFISAVAGMQNHMTSVEYFLSQSEPGKKLLNDYRRLPKVWEENILVIEDDKAVSNLLKAIVDDIGKVDQAFNGKEGLEMLEKKFYKVIFTDINMPLMNGLDFYKAASERYDNLHERVVFFSGQISPQREKLFKDWQVKYMLKPTPILKIREAAYDIMKKVEEK